jgi:hypothetical protein
LALGEFFVANPLSDEGTIGDQEMKQSPIMEESHQMAIFQ